MLLDNELKFLISVSLLELNNKKLLDNDAKLLDTVIKLVADNELAL